MKNIWAPWRMKYILSPKPAKCIFCQMQDEDRDRENLILLRRDNAYVIMNRYPYNNGHLMVLPYLHTSDMEGLTPPVLAGMMELTRLSTRCLGAEMRPEGFNIGINVGAAAGAGIEEHIHIHIVPRWAGDASFMTILDEVRVVPEHLTETYNRLLPHFMAKEERT